MPELTSAGRVPVWLAFATTGTLALVLWYCYLKPYMIKVGRLKE